MYVSYAGVLDLEALRGMEKLTGAMVLIYGPPDDTGGGSTGVHNTGGNEKHVLLDDIVSLPPHVSDGPFASGILSYRDRESFRLLWDRQLVQDSDFGETIMFFWVEKVCEIPHRQLTCGSTPEQCESSMDPDRWCRNFTQNSMIDRAERIPGCERVDIKTTVDVGHGDERAIVGDACGCTAKRSDCRNSMR